MRELPCSQIVVNKTSKACKLWDAGGVLTRAGEASNNPGKYSGTRDLKGRRQPRSVTKFPNQLSTRSFSRMADSAIVPSIVVYVTVPSKELGKKLAESIVKEKLAACVSIVPGIQSIYWWDGKVQTDSEELLIIKTRESLLNSLTEHVKANHEYDVPEVIALPINGGNEKYLEWIKNSTRDK